MSEEETVTQEATQEQAQESTVDLSQLMAENAAMKAKMDELLTEAKKAKTAKRAIEEESQAERERIAKEKATMNNYISHPKKDTKQLLRN